MRRNTRSALRALAAVAALCVSVTTVVAAPQNVPSPIALVLHVESPVAVGQKAPARVRITNTSGKKLKFGFQERDLYGRPLSYPVGLRARVLDASGAVLTESERAPDGWWSAHELLNPHILVRTKTQQIELKNGEAIEREFLLGDVLAGSPTLGAGFSPGAYRVQVSINGVESNAVTVEVTR